MAWRLVNVDHTWPISFIFEGHYWSFFQIKEGNRSNLSGFQINTFYGAIQEKRSEAGEEDWKENWV